MSNTLRQMQFDIHKAKTLLEWADTQVTLDDEHYGSFTDKRVLAYLGRVSSELLALLECGYTLTKSEEK